MTDGSAPRRGLGLVERLSAGPVLCAEGYVFELERRGYLQAGPYVPEVVLDHPEQVTALHEQFVHAGSDVVVAGVDVPVAALPVPYRTSDGQPTFQTLREPDDVLLPARRAFPTALDPFTCNRYEVAAFTRMAVAAGVRYLGLCCGAAPHHVRSMAEALGRTPPASQYSEDMSKHVFLGTDNVLASHNLDYKEQL